MNGRFRILQMMLGSQEDSHHVSHSGFDIRGDIHGEQSFPGEQAHCFTLGSGCNLADNFFSSGISGSVLEFRHFVAVLVRRDYLVTLCDPQDFIQAGLTIEHLTPAVIT